MANKEDLKRFHQQSILDAAKRLFVRQGMEQTTMNDIAEEAQYSKSTLYVYFKSKDEIYQYLIYEFNYTLRDLLVEVMEEYDSSKDSFLAFCHSIARLQKKNPFYFEVAMNNVRKGENEVRQSPVLKETTMVNVKIHEAFREFLERGMARGEIRPDIDPHITAFSLWCSIYGTISMAYQKEEFLHRFYKVEMDEYLEKAFTTILNSILVQRI